jgi:hypothetical protein
MHPCDIAIVLAEGILYYLMFHQSSKEEKMFPVVGDSKLEKVLVELDNKLFQKKEKELVEKYFNVADIDKAWAFVRS